MKEPRNRLRMIRFEKRLTQWELAHMLRSVRTVKLSQTKLSLIENDYVEPSPEERAALAKALGVPETDVFPEVTA